MNKVETANPASGRITLVLIFIFISSLSMNVFAQFVSTTDLTNLSVSGDAPTGEKPQSKVWFHAGKWWSVLQNNSGVSVWRLDNTTWTQDLTLAGYSNVQADCLVNGDTTYVLLYKGTSSKLISIEYSPTTGSYELWSVQPDIVSVNLDSGVETAVIEMDSLGVMWVAYAGTTQIYVKSSVWPYTNFTNRVQLNTDNVKDDDICDITRFGGNKIGVLWSNQEKEKFYFKYHNDGDDATLWSDQETAASGSTNSGVGDDHINFAVASDGTIYAAVKTSYDDGNGVLPEIGLLVRRTNGNWDDPLYTVTQGQLNGTRPIALLNEEAGKIFVIYTDDPGTPRKIKYRYSSTSSISFSSSQTLIDPPGSTEINNVTSTKNNFTNEVVFLASNSSTAYGMIGYTYALPELSAKVFLQGAYSGGTMTTSLNSQGLIPLDQPYNTAPWYYFGSESVSSIPTGVVDWVLLELRTGTASSTVVERKAAFIKSDGSIVGLDGSSTVKFSTITAGNYYIVVKQRNHLSIMSATARTFYYGSVTSYDFTTSQSKAYTTGGSPMADLGGSHYGMICGDPDANTGIGASDLVVTRSGLGSTTYNNQDVDLNGGVGASDLVIIRQNLGKVTQVP